MIWETRWRQIPEFPDYYVSDDDRVVNAKKKKLCHVLNGKKNYQLVALYKNGKRYTRSIEKLRRAAFHGEKNK